MPAYYLANLIIESDKGLANFSGDGVITPFNGKVNLLQQEAALAVMGSHS